MSAGRTAPRLLFVCLGNICRSPLVEQVARETLAAAGIEATLASCGTGGWHAGEGADPRMVAAARQAGHDLARHRARQLRARDFADFDLLLAMDRDNQQGLLDLAPDPAAAARVHLYLQWTQAAPPAEFPDPWYGGEADFRAAVALAERSMPGLLARLAAR